MKLYKILRKKEETTIKNESGLELFVGDIIDVDFEEFTTMPYLTDIPYHSN